MRNREDKPDQCHFCGRTTADGIKLVIGPAGANICTDCAKQAIELGSNLKGKSKPKPIGRIPTPAEIVARLDQYVIGQEDSKKTLAVAVYNHYCRLAAKDGYDSEGNPLSKDDLKELANVEIEEELMRVLTEPKNALTKQYKKLLRLSNVRVEFDEASLRKMARMAIERKTGARGLKAEMENLMRDVMFRITDKRKVGEVVRITEDMFKEAA